MAARKKKKATTKKSSSRAAKTKKAPARKAKKTTKKAGKKASRKPAKSAKASRKPAARKTAKKTARRKQTVGEGDYEGSRAFLKDQSDFVKKNRSSIPAMGKDAGRALEGPEGASLREAEAEAASRSRDNIT